MLLHHSEQFFENCIVKKFVYWESKLIIVIQCNTNIDKQMQEAVVEINCYCFFIIIAQQQWNIYFISIFYC